MWVAQTTAWTELWVAAGSLDVCGLGPWLARTSVDRAQLEVAWPWSAVSADVRRPRVAWSRTALDLVLPEEHTSASAFIQSAKAWLSLAWDFLGHPSVLVWPVGQPFSMRRLVGASGREDSSRLPVSCGVSQPKCIVALRSLHRCAEPSFYPTLWFALQ